MLQYLGFEISPSEGLMTPPIHFISVDLPAPLCPAKEMRSFGRTVKLRFSNRTRGPYSTLMFLIASTEAVYGSSAKSSILM